MDKHIQAQEIILKIDTFSGQNSLKSIFLIVKKTNPRFFINMPEIDIEVFK